MIRTLLLVPAVAAVALFAARPAAAAPPVAVVDMVRLIEAHPESAALDAKFDKARKEAKANAEQEGERLAELGKQIQLLNAGDPERLRKQKQYEQQQGAMRFNVEWAERMAVQDYARGLELLYRAVANQVKAYAREQGIQLVLQKRDLEVESQAQTPEDFGLRQRLRLVVYAAAETDITAAILERIQAAAPTPPGGTAPAGNR